MKIGEILAHTREQQGLSQKELAQLLSAAGVTVTDVISTSGTSVLIP